MFKLAILFILLQLAPQTIATAKLCDNIETSVKNRTLAYSLLCSRCDQRLEDCCKVIEQDLKWYEQAYSTQCKNKVVFKSCADLYKFGERKDGVYTINPDGIGTFQVRCDMHTDGGGWTVFQRRQDGSQDFYRPWSDYKSGFGDPNGEFWLGLDKIHRLSKSGQNILRIDMMDFNKATRYAKYEKFSLGDEQSKFQLDIGTFSGNTGDSLSYHNRVKFSTRDNDNDQSGGNCALNWKGGWWYKSCAYANLNGRYLGKGNTHYSGDHWRGWKMDSLKEVEMKIRPSLF